uniref:Desiccation-related protein PCC13-62-like n=1 Tax=Nicotiana tabacum TaxID=4097 RepID=A0A1S3ZVG5_TOBAC|nr:PREDICTED: desiccation-related protein PCC13-62-like [Nicotiana tabacum]
MRENVTKLTSELEAAKEREKIRDAQYIGMQEQIKSLLASGSFPIPQSRDSSPEARLPHAHSSRPPYDCSSHPRQVHPSGYCLGESSSDDDDNDRTTAIKNTVAGFPRPLLNQSREAFATVMNDAFGHQLEPPFNPYANDINYLLASYVIPYLGLTGYVGANPKLHSPTVKRLLVGLLGVESGQDAVLRALLYEHGRENVEPYGITAIEFTNSISELRNKLGRHGLKNEGLKVKPTVGAEGKIRENILAGDKYSLSYDRTPEEILRIVYGSGNENKPGGFYPKGADGQIAKSYLGVGGN